MARTLEWRRAGGGVATRGQKAFSGLLVLSLVSMLVAMAAVTVRPAATGAQDGALQTATVVPETALLYAAVNLDMTSDQAVLSADLLERSGLGTLFRSQTDEVLDGDDAADIEPFLGGEAALVATRFPSADQLPLDGLTEALGGGLDPEGAAADVTDVASMGGFAALVLAPDPDAAFAKAEEILTERADETGAEVQTTDYEGVEITTVMGGDDGASNPMAIARVGDYVVLAATAADIEPLVDVEAGRTPSLADSDNFSTLRDELNDEFMLWAYINGPALRDGMTSEAENQDLANVEFLFGDGMTALDAYTGVVVFADDPGFRLDTISIPTSDTALAGGQNFDSELDERVSSDTLLFVNGVDLGTNPLLQAVGLAIAQSINGEEAGVLPEGMDAEEYATTQYERAAGVLGFNLKTELLDLLTGEFAFALSVSNLLSPDGFGGAIVSGISDPATVADAVSQVALIVAAGAGETTTVSTREVDGQTVNVVEDTSTGFPLRVEYGVIGERLIIGLGNGLSDIVAGPTEALADNPTYQAVMAELPAEHGASAYINLAQIITFAEFFLGTATGGGDFEDAAPECGTYATQEEAQTAYDEDPGSLIDLDQDFDGEACEDYFATEDDAAAAPPDFSALQALGHVQFERDGLRGSSTILYITE